MNRSLLGALALAGALSPLAGHAALVSVTAPGEIIPAPPRVLNDDVTNDHQQGFNERQGVLLVAPLSIDGGAIPAGTVVDSHMIFLNISGRGPVSNQGVIWTFDGLVLGVMSDTGGTLEAASSTLLGAIGTTYPAAFPNRGLENQDGYVISGNQLTVNMRVTQPGDWIRVITANPVPEPGTVAAGAALTVLAGLALWRRRA
jgi:MYXO-CTERM domain-containing protein